MTAGVEERRLQQMLAARLQRQLQQRECQPCGAEAERERQVGGRLVREDTAPSAARAEGHGAVAEISEELPGGMHQPTFHDAGG